MLAQAKLHGVPIVDEHSTNIRWRGHCVCAWEGRKVHVNEYMLALLVCGRVHVCVHVVPQFAQTNKRFVNHCVTCTCTCTLLMNS